MNVGEILQTNDRFYRNNSNKPSVSSIETNQLPEQIQQLITGSDYWRKAKENRYKKLIRDGHLADLMLLAEEAQKKNRPDHWFAKAASKVEWSRTLEFLTQLRKVAETAAEVARRLTALPKQMPAIYKACWRQGGAVIKHAITAQETGRDPFKYFCWLTREAKRC